jgi:hypothetical protein
MEAMRKALDQSLRQGDVTRAVAAARKWAIESKEPARETAIEIARTVGAVYRDLVTTPVEEFLAQTPTTLPADVAAVVQKALERLLRVAANWQERLAACREERLARELRDLVREDKFQPALERVRALCQTSAPESDPARAEELERRALYVANVLGTCLNHPRETDKLLALLAREPGTYGLTGDLVARMQATKQHRHGQMMASRQENLENQWSAQLKALQVEILQAMPGRNEMGEPEPEQLRDVGDIFRSVVRAPLDRQQPDMWIDVTLVLIDFAPKELASSAAASGIEGRSYAQLGFRARKAVAVTMLDLGKNDRLTGAYLQWAREAGQERYEEQIVEFMGALRSEAFGPHLVDLWKRRREPGLREELSVAIGNLASPEAADVLLAELKDVFTNKATSVADTLKRLNEFKTSVKGLDAGAVRRAERLLRGLGRIVRSPRTDDGVRRRIIDAVVAAVPEDNRRLGQAVVTEVLAGRPEALTEKERAFAIGKLTDALWVQDQSTDMHKGGEREATVIGTRAELARALGRLGKDRVEMLVAEFDRHATRYSGAYIAVAEILQELKDPRAVPLLHKMLFQAAMFDEASLNQYQKETYWDTTEQRRKELTKDMVTAALVFALVQIGGSEANGTLGEFGKRVQSGQIRGIGQETLELLAKNILPGPGSEPAPAPRAATPPPVAGGADEPLIGKAATARSATAQADPEEVRRLVKAITGSYLLTSATKRAQAKIEALVRLAQLTPDEALDPIFQNLADKDPMVVSAAISTLSEYAAAGKPGYLLEMLLERMENAMTGRNAALRMATPKLLREIGPARPEIRKRLVPLAKTLEHADVKAAMANVLQDIRAAGPGPTPKPMPDEKAPEDRPGDAQPKAANTQVDLLELKRQYMQERRRWIQGGKRGDPPSPPPGVTL